MYSVKIAILAFMLSVTFYSIHASKDYYAYAKVQSCRGCRLNSLPDVKKFIFEDVPTYEKVEFVEKFGANPELFIYDKNDEEIERLKLAHLSREECNELLVSKGFKKKPAIIKDEI